MLPGFFILTHMEPSMNPVIPKQKPAHTAQFYFQINHLGCSLVADGDLGSDTIPIYYVNSAGEKTTAKDSEGNDLEITADNPAVPIYFACNVQIEKGLTSNAVGVNIHGLG